MAVRFVNTGSWTASAALSGNAYTVLFWYNLAVDRNTWQEFFRSVPSSGQNHFFETKSDGTNLTFSGGGGDVGNFASSLNTWYCAAAVVNGSSVTVYHGLTPTSLSSTSGSCTSINTITSVIVANGVNGRMANLKYYNGTLTLDQITQELEHYVPTKTDTLLHWHPFLTADEGPINFAGNGGDFTGTPTVTTEDGPPIRWARARGPRVKLTPPPDITVDLDFIDITSEIPNVEVDHAADLDLFDITVESPTPEVGRIYDVDPVDIDIEVEAIIPDVIANAGIVEVSVQTIALDLLVEKQTDINDVVETAIEIPDVDVAHATPEPIDPQFITIEFPAVEIIQTAFGVQAINTEVQLPPVEVGYAYDVDPIDISVVAEEVEHLREISLDPVDIEVTPEFVSVIQTVYSIGFIDIPVETLDVDVANEAEIDQLAISVSLDGQPARIQHAINLTPIDISVDVDSQSVITYQSYRVNIVDVATELPVPELGHIADVDIVTINPLLTGQSPDLARLVDLSVITITPTAMPTTTQAFDDEPIQINVIPEEVTVGFSVENFSYVQGLQPEPFVEPSRIIAQDIRTKKFLHWELPLNNLVIDYNLSGAVVISGVFDNEVKTLEDINLEPEATWIHVEENGQIRASGILQPTTAEKGQALTLEAVGPSAYPSGQPYDGKFEGVFLDPADIIRHIWAYLQSYSDGNLGVVVTGNTPVKVGKPLPPPPPDPLPEGYVDPNPDDDQDKPYQLLWWEGPDCGQEINRLLSDGKIDYVERSQWNEDKTDVLHFIDLAYPRAGRKTELTFTEGENLIEAIAPKEIEGFFASAVILYGKGEGSSIVRGYAAAPNPRRLRKVVVLTDPTVDNKTRANRLCEIELQRRQAILDVEEVLAEARHQNARLGSFVLGDDVRVRASLPRYGEIDQFQRIIGYTYFADSEQMRVRMRRSESFSYGTGATT
jgi:hypothetical protein